MSSTTAIIHQDHTKASTVGSGVSGSKGARSACTNNRSVFSSYGVQVINVILSLPGS